VLGFITASGYAKILLIYGIAAKKLYFLLFKKIAVFCQHSNRSERWARRKGTEGKCCGSKPVGIVLGILLNFTMTEGI